MGRESIHTMYTHIHTCTSTGTLSIVKFNNVHTMYLHMYTHTCIYMYEYRFSLEKMPSQDLGCVVLLCLAFFLRVLIVYTCMYMYM